MSQHRGIERPVPPDVTDRALHGQAPLAHSCESSWAPVGREQDPERFLQLLEHDALSHRAVRHPLLLTLGRGSLRDERWLLADFARQYSEYAAHFPSYLAAVISRLTDARHRTWLLENLQEESGHYHQADLEVLEAAGLRREWFDGTPHPELFARFARALGVDPRVSEAAEEVICWREMFQHVLTGFCPAQAVGAMGLGTESIVAAIYEPLVAAIERQPGLTPRDAVFFPLHTLVDDDHQAKLRAIATDFARTPAGRTGLRRGMLKALNLRAGFWDWLHARALDRTASREVS